jgi:NADH-quinone oxidoreductase subunit F
MDFEHLKEAGLPLGSGVVFVINQDRDLRQTLLGLAHFFAHESCGKCFPCQLGTQRQLEIIAKVAEGSATKGDIAALEDIGFAMTNASLCGLGMTAGTAILSALDLWPQIFLPGGE